MEHAPDGGVWRGRRIARVFESPDGLVILVGRTAADNDTLTFKVAQPKDFWLHVQGHSGSHVVVRNPEGLDRLPPDTEEMAAALAAGYSQARNAGRVGVHLTQRRELRSSTRPGRVEVRSSRVVQARPLREPEGDE